VLRWWLAYLIVPAISFFGVATAALTGSVGAAIAAIVVAAGLASVPVVLGWKLVRALDAAQRASLPS